ncbi:MAG: oligopeptide ABC transporter permease OppB [Wenzhouxiangella sp.]|jgi:oligopeptide transport system permease protein|nr:oligopeptide ABC transporter permease OppB [Wenzhouxiangella sp.]
MLPRYILKRLLGAIPTLFILVTIAFFLIRIAPGGPFDSEKSLPAEVQANLDAKYNLDQPLPVQYVRYLGSVLRGDLGPSFQYSDFTVNELIAEGFPVSIRLGASALVLALVFGVAIGTVAAWRQNSRLDYALMGSAMTGIAIPNFVLAPILILVFAVYFGWLPAGGWGSGEIRNMVLPVIALALPYMAYVARLTRGSMVETLRSDFVRTARAKGLPEWKILGKHSLKVALLPVVSYLGPAAAAIITGSVVIEQIFGLPGMGRYFVQGALNRDYTLVMGVVIVIGLLIVVFNLIVDIIYALIDPRIRYE